MISDHETNTVFTSDLLKTKQPSVAQGLRRILGDRLHLIPGTKDIWCRDFMPIQLSEDRFVQFKYDPDYLRKRPQLGTENGCDLLGLKNCRRSDLVIDGGNVVHGNDTAILTEKVFRENHGWGQSALESELKRELEADRLVFIPVDPEDPIGHADGMVRFVDGQTLLVNDYSAVDERFEKRLYRALVDFKLIRFPFEPTDEPGTDPGIPPALGIYINFLQIENLIVCPVFNQPADDLAIKTLEAEFPGTQIVPLDCRKLALEGGVLNCVTWTVMQ